MQAQKTERNGRNELCVARIVRKRLNERTLEVDGREINNSQQESDLGNQERPKMAPSGQRRFDQVSAETGPAGDAR